MKPAPDLQVCEWLHTSTELSLNKLQGKVVLIEAFQMLCPGCVSHALPQAKRVAELFDSQDVVVLGLHTVFEHHKAQGTRDALAAFLHEYRIAFPVGIDQPSSDHSLPKTMHAYQMQGRGVGFGHWDYLTVENADRSVELLAELVAWIARLPARLP